MHYTSLPFGVIFSQALSPIQGSFKQRETQYMIHMILPSIKLNTVSAILLPYSLIEPQVIEKSSFWGFFLNKPPLLA